MSRSARWSISISWTHLERRARAGRSGTPQLQAAFHGDHWFSTTSPETAPSQRSISMQPLLFYSVSSGYQRESTLGSPPGRKQGRCPISPGSQRHGVRPQATTQDPGAHSGPSCLVLQPEGRRSTPGACSPPAGLGSGEGGGCALYRVAWGQPPLRTPSRSAISLPTGLGLTLVPRWVPRVGFRGAQPASSWALGAHLCSLTGSAPTQLR